MDGMDVNYLDLVRDRLYKKKKIKETKQEAPRKLKKNKISPKKISESEVIPSTDGTKGTIHSFKISKVKSKDLHLTTQNSCVSTNDVVKKKSKKRKRSETCSEVIPANRSGVQAPSEIKELKAKNLPVTTQSSSVNNNGLVKKKSKKFKHLENNSEVIANNSEVLEPNQVKKLNKNFKYSVEVPSNLLGVKNLNEKEEQLKSKMKKAKKVRQHSKSDQDSVFKDEYTTNYVKQKDKTVVESHSAAPINNDMVVFDLNAIDENQTNYITNKVKKKKHKAKLQSVQETQDYNEDKTQDWKTETLDNSCFTSEYEIELNHQWKKGKKKIKPAKIKHEIPKLSTNSTTPPHNFFDDNNVTVKGLSFNKLCSPFTSKYEVDSESSFVIPQHLIDLTTSECLEYQNVDEPVLEESGPIPSKHRDENYPQASVLPTVLDATNTVASKFETENVVLQQENNPGASLLSGSLKDQNEDMNQEQQTLSTEPLKNSEELFEAETQVPPHENNLEAPVSSNVLNTADSLKVQMGHDQQTTSIDLVENSEALFETENMVLRKPHTVKAMLKDDTIISIIDLNQRVYFNGLCRIQVLHGEVSILGATINKAHGEKPVYSPKGHALLYLRNSNQQATEESMDLQQLLSADLLKENLSFQQHCAVVWFKQLNDPSVSFIERHVSQKIFPEQVPKVRIDFDLSGTFNLTKDSEAWRDIIENIGRHSKVAICGGKGVGKSTFLRYAINSLLGKYGKVRVVDLDPGQSELFPPGCLSVTTVQEMVLGPNYTHLQTPDCAVLSHINMSYDIKQYFQALKYILSHLSLSGDLPTLINFPGLTHGIGLDISIKALKLLLPNTVIEIKSKNSQKNYAVDLTTRNVNRWFTMVKILQDGENEDSKVYYQYIKLDSLAEKSGGWALEGRRAREFCLLSYFGKMMSENVRQLTSCEIPMYNINISALHFVNHEGNSISPLVVNASVVALCFVDSNEPELFVCQGFGFVRGVDLDNNTLVLITPEPSERLDSVTHIVLSSVTTPPSLLMKAEGLKGLVPYINVGGLVDFGQFTKRPYLPPRIINA